MISARRTQIASLCGLKFRETLIAAQTARIKKEKEIDGSYLKMRNVPIQHYGQAIGTWGTPNASKSPAQQYTSAAFQYPTSSPTHTKASAIQQIHGQGLHSSSKPQYNQGFSQRPSPTPSSTKTVVQRKNSLTSAVKAELTRGSTPHRRHHHHHHHHKQFTTSTIRNNASTERRRRTQSKSQYRDFRRDHVISRYG